MQRTQLTTSTVFIFTTRKPGTTFEQFKSYYETHHAYVITGFFTQCPCTPLSYIRNYIERDSGDTTPSFPLGGADSWDYDCVSQLVFENQQQRDELFAEFGKHAEAIGEDEENFLDRSKTKFIFVPASPADVRK